MNIPNIPDNLHKTLFIIGLFCIGFSYYKYDQNIISLESDAEKIINLSNDSHFQKNKVVELEYEFKNLCKEESLKLGLENFCGNGKSGELEFYRILDGTKEQIRISDSLSVIWSKILHERNIRDNLIDKVEFALEDLKFAIEATNESNEFNIAFGIFGCLILFIGLGRWWKIQNIQDQILISQIPKQNIYKHCQSCARNFSFRVNHGTKSDDTESELFCSDCYLKGEFTDFINEDSINKKKMELLNGITDEKI
jgi:hypothetical protein